MKLKLKLSRETLEELLSDSLKKSLEGFLKKSLEVLLQKSLEEFLREAPREFRKKKYVGFFLEKGDFLKESIRMFSKKYMK